MPASSKTRPGLPALTLAAFAVAAIGVASACSQPQPTARNELVQKLYDGREHIQIEGAMALGEGANRLECAELARAAQGASIPVRQALATALGKAQAPEAVDYLGSFLNDRDDSVRAAAVRALATRKEEKARAYVTSAYARGGSQTRAAIAALGPEILEEAVVSESEGLKEQYQRPRHGDGCCPWKPDLADGCGSCPQQLREEGLRLLGLHGSPRARAELALRLVDPSPWVAAAAAEGLALAQANEHADELFSAMRSFRPLVSAAAGLALRDLGHSGISNELARLVPQGTTPVALELLQAIEPEELEENGRQSLCEVARNSSNSALAIEALLAANKQCELRPLKLPEGDFDDDQPSLAKAGEKAQTPAAPSTPKHLNSHHPGLTGSTTLDSTTPDPTSPDSQLPDSQSPHSDSTGSASAEEADTGSVPSAFAAADSPSSDSPPPDTAPGKTASSDSDSSSDTQEESASAAKSEDGTPQPQPPRYDVLKTRLKVLAAKGEAEPSSLELARQLLEHEDASLAAAAAEFLGFAGNQDDGERLLELAESERQLLLRERIVHARRLHERRILRHPTLFDSQELVDALPALQDAVERREKSPLTQLIRKRESGQVEEAEHRQGASLFIQSAALAAARLGADTQAIAARLLDDESADFRLTSVHIAEIMGDAGADLREQMHHDEDQAVQVQAALSSARLGDPGSQERLERLLHHENDASQRLRLVKALAPYAEDASPSLIRAASRTDTAAAYALALLSRSSSEVSEELLALAESQIEHSSGFGAFPALELLAKSADDGQVLQSLVRATVHPQGPIRAKSLELLSEKGACPSTAKALIHDFEQRVRLAARAALETCESLGVMGD